MDVGGVEGPLERARVPGVEPVVPEGPLSARARALAASSLGVRDWPSGRALSWASGDLDGGPAALRAETFQRTCGSTRSSAWVAAGARHGRRVRGSRLRRPGPGCQGRIRDPTGGVMKQASREAVETGWMGTVGHERRWERGARPAGRVASAGSVDAGGSRGRPGSVLKSHDRQLRATAPSGLGCGRGTRGSTDVDATRRRVPASPRASIIASDNTRYVASSGPPRC